MAPIEIIENYYAKSSVESNYINNKTYLNNDGVSVATSSKTPAKDHKNFSKA